MITDYWRAYKEFITEAIHTQSKAEISMIDGYNSIFRHYLARMKRKSKCYTKNLEMLSTPLFL